MNVSANSPSHYNPLEYFNDGSRSNIADEKAELVNSLVETCKREPLSAKESSIVNKALKYIYNEAALTGNMPTLTDLHAALGKSKNRKRLTCNGRLISLCMVPSIYLPSSRMCR